GACPACRRGYTTGWFPSSAWSGTCIFPSACRCSRSAGTPNEGGGVLSERAGEFPARSRARAVLVSIRPTQWTKNGVLLVAPVFAHRATDAASVVRALIAVAAFCLLASAVYVANGVADREHDRIPPVKRRRPIAAAELSVELATGLTAMLAFAGLALAGVLGASFQAVGLGYLGLQAAYTFVLRRLVIV